MPRRLHHEDYTVGWVCALAIELVAAQEMLDEEHDTPSCNAHDTNIYTCGRIGEHYVVIACLPEGRMGTTSAATVANQMKMAFTSIRFGLMVGIGGGIPSEHADIRLGDVIVSKPQKVHGGVVQYDFGKATISGFERTGFLDGPPTVLLNAVTNLRAKHMRRRGKLLECLSKLDSLPEFTREAAGADVLFEAEYQHVGGATCENCSKEYVLVRETRRHEVMVHYGTIASGNEVIQDAAVRDRVSADLGGVLCFEMEAAGLMNSFPCLVIRGISDYADSHKNEQWQPYAAATAAAYAKELLSVIPVLEVNNTRTAKEATDETGDHPAGSSAPAKRRMDDSLTELEASHGNQQTVTPVAKECLRSLAFREQEQRYDNVHTAQHTCQWLLEDRQYRAWLDSPRGLFLIKGHPGTGKSVLIKFAVNALRKEKPDGLIVSFFIHGQGNDLQHTPLGIFRALLNSMLERFPEHLSQLTNIFEERNRRFGDYKEGRWGWTVGELQDTLSQVLREGTTHEPVTIFIDALDECGEEAAKGLLTYLNKQAGCETAQVKICVSSRHYPILSRDNIPGVLVEEHNAADIARFTQDRLERIQSADERRQIELKIRRKAQGGFQWVLLVTEMMIDGDLKGLKLERLRKKLDSCPGTLSELYAAILNDVAGAEERQLTKLFEWILFAERPLSAQELREALVTEPDMSCTSISELRDHDSWSDTLDAFERHVKHLSKGLVEFQTREFWELYDPEGEDWNREAQLIHQSVADFLLEKFLAPNSMGDPRIPTSLGGAGHFRISRSCLRYLTLKEVLNEAQSPRAALSSKYTLAPYAVRYAFQHIRKVEQAGIIQDDLLSAMQWASRSEITRKLAQLWRTLDPDSAHTPLGWPFEGATALHVLAACGSKTACSTVLNIGLGEVDRKDANGNTPLMLAIREKHQDIALMLVDSSVERRSLYHERGVGDVRENLNVRADGAGDLDVTNDEGDTALTIALDENAGEVILRLIEAGAELKYLGQHSALVALAISSRNMPVLDILIQNQINLDGAVYFVLDDESAQGDPSLLGLVSKLLEAKANTTKSKEGPLSGFSGRYDHHALTVASRSGTTKMVDLLLSYGASATDQNERGETPLMAAVINGHKQIVQTLLQSAPSAVEIADENGTPVLFAALQSGQPELLDVLLRQGHFSDPVRSRESLFVEISRRGLANMITFMLQRYTMDLNLQDENRCTPLLLAAENGHLEAVKLLLKENADLETPNQDGWTPLISASEKGYLEIAKSLLDKGADWSTAAKDRWTALNAASSNGHVEIVKLLLEKGADSTANNEGGTPLLSASSNGHLDIVELLLDNGADWTADKDGWTPLHSASREGHLEVVKLLLDRGADASVGNKRGWTPLHSASSMGCLDVVELLLEKGAKSIANKDGSTPLNIAASYGQLKVVELLLNKGADLSLANNNGRTPLSSASFHGHVEVAKLLLEKGAYNASSGLEPHYGTIANMLALKGYTDLLRFIVEHSNASMNEADNHNRNPLQFAASGGHIDSFQYLVSKGLQFTTLDAKGDNLISLAASGGSLDILTVVLEQKLDAVARPEHWNPLHWACRAGKVKVVELLIAQGWKSDIVTVAGLQGEWTPLAVAIFHGNNDMLDGLSESSRAALGAQNEKPYLTGKRHGGCSCNGCYHEIYGPRFQCMVCKFQDYCFMCKPFLQHLHKGHKWKLFESWDPSKTYGEQRL